MAEVSQVIENGNIFEIVPPVLVPDGVVIDGLAVVLAHHHIRHQGIPESAVPKVMPMVLGRYDSIRRMHQAASSPPERYALLLTVATEGDLTVLVSKGSA
jgi:hypothetical protein